MFQPNQCFYVKTQIFLLLTFVKSDYENNYWGDINPNSTEWIEEFVTNEYTDNAPKTWIEKPHQDMVENTTSKDETNNEKTASLNQDTKNEKTTTNLMANETISLNQNSTNEKTTTNFEAGNSTSSISNLGPDSRSATYITKKNSIANKINSINYTNIVLIILILAVFAYGIYRFKK